MFFFFHSFFLQIEKYHMKENAEKRKKIMKKYIELQIVWQSWIFTTNTNRSNLFFISSHSSMKCASIWIKDNTVLQSKLSTFSLMEKWPWSSLFLSQLNHFLLQSYVDSWIHWCSSWQDFLLKFLLLSHEFHSNEQCIWRHKSLISTKNDLSIWQCIICLKFTWIGKLLNFSFKSSERWGSLLHLLVEVLGDVEELLLDVSDNLSRLLLWMHILSLSRSSSSSL